MTKSMPILTNITNAACLIDFWVQILFSMSSLKKNFFYLLRQISFRICDVNKSIWKRDWNYS